MLTIICGHRMADIAPFREAINALNLASTQPDPFSTFEFFAHYAATAERFHDQTGFRLWMLLAFAGDRLVGYLALKQTTQRVLGLPCVKLDLLASYIAGRPHIVCHPDHAAAVSTAMYSYLLGRPSGWSLLELPQQDAGSALRPPPAAAGEGRFRLRVWSGPPHGPIPLQGVDSLAGYFASLSTKMRSNVSRQMRKLMAAGELTLQTSTGPTSVKALYQLYRRIEPHSWKARAGAHIGRDARSQAYYQGLIDHQQPMRIVIQILLLDGVPVAGLINGAFDTGLYAMEMVFDDRYAELAPGSAMMFFGVRLALQNGCAFYDLLWGFDYHKSRWRAVMHDTSCIQIYRIDRPFFWRRIVGDKLRRLLPRATDADGNVRFNPPRRQAGRTDHSAAVSTDNPPERSSADDDVAPETGACGECLSSAQLRALLPFPVSPAVR